MRPSRDLRKGPTVKGSHHRRLRAAVVGDHAESLPRGAPGGGPGPGQPSRTVGEHSRSPETWNEMVARSRQRVARGTEPTQRAEAAATGGPSALRHERDAWLVMARLVASLRVPDPDDQPTPITTRHPGVHPASSHPLRLDVRAGCEEHPVKRGTAPRCWAPPSGQALILTM
jgi:hypothetical protein